MFDTAEAYAKGQSEVEMLVCPTLHILLQGLPSMFIEDVS